MPAFEQAFARIIGNEGGFTSNQLDPGNWTGGKPGEGECRGTKYGISAHAYPSLDIAGLTLADAYAIYRRDYGPGRARQWLVLAQKQSGGAAICAEFQAQRMAFMASLPTWKTFGLGWSRRLCRLPYDSLTMTE
jgi:lysozyme family protein